MATSRRFLGGGFDYPLTDDYVAAAVQGLGVEPPLTEEQLEVLTDIDYPSSSDVEALRTAIVPDDEDFIRL